MSVEHIPFHFKDWEDRDQGVHAQEQRSDVYGRNSRIHITFVLGDSLTGKNRTEEQRDDCRNN